MSEIPVQACGAKISYMVICKMEAMCCFVMFGGCSMVTGRRCVARNIGVGAVWGLSPPPTLGRFRKSLKLRSQLNIFIYPKIYYTIHTKLK